MSKRIMYISCCGHLTIEMLAAAFSPLLKDYIAIPFGKHMDQTKELVKIHADILSDPKKLELVNYVAACLNVADEIYLPGFMLGPMMDEDSYSLLMEHNNIGLSPHASMLLPDPYVLTCLMVVKRCEKLSKETKILNHYVYRNDCEPVEILLLEEKESDQIIKLETNIDDCSGEVLGYAMEKLLKAGARDVSYHPIFMKKNRPAWELVVLCDEEHRKALEEIIFTETTSIGIRRCIMERSVLKRSFKEVTTPVGKVTVKICEGDGFTKIYPEYESARVLAMQSGKSLSEIYDMIAKVEKA